MMSLCRHLSAQEIVNWVTTADGCVHTADADATQLLRRRCVQNSRLVGDSLDESEQICQQRSPVASCRRCERTRPQS